MKPSYTVYFEDFTAFKGGSPENSKWNLIPKDKKILKLIYMIDGQKLIFREYESYNHLVEWVAFFSKKSVLPLRVILMAKKRDNVVSVVTYNLKMGEFEKTYNSATKKIGIERFVAFGKELRGGSTTGWKKGIKNGNPKFIQKID